MRILLIVLELFLALGALGGAGAMLASPDGSQLGVPPDMLEGSGFSNFVVPAVLLLLANGVFPLVVAIAAMQRRSWAPYGHVMVGCVLTGWIAIQGLLIGFGHWLQIFYLALGLIIAALGLIAVLRGKSSRGMGEELGPVRVT